MTTIYIHSRIVFYNLYHQDLICLTIIRITIFKHIFIIKSYILYNVSMYVHMIYSRSYELQIYRFLKYKLYIGI